MNTALYSLQCLTNLHVGNGDVNYNIIGNEVERDVTTFLPTIHSSGMKGAYREYFEQSGSDSTILLFGSPVIKSSAVSENDIQKIDSKPGSLKFFPANILGKPVRVSDGNFPYCIATTKMILEGFLRMAQALSVATLFEMADLQDIDPDCSYKCSKYTIHAVEGVETLKSLTAEPLKQFLNKWLGDNAVILAEEIFRSIPLPVIARNCLENGESKNIWYEEIVPHESVFYSYVLSISSDTESLASFENIVNENVIQFGGNASIGYGYTTVRKKG